jgi:hypothetical protein
MLPSIDSLTILLFRLFPLGSYNAIQIVDWYHAADRLKRIAEEAFFNTGERQAWLDHVTEDLWQGRVESVIDACQLLEKKSNLVSGAKRATEGKKPV